jgi:hypothetical protein
MVLALLALPTAAVEPRIEVLAVKPNPAVFSGATPPQVEIAITIERPTPLDLTCDALLDPGDGSGKYHVSFGIGDRRTKTVRHVYRMTGSFKVTVAGTGKNACDGAHELVLTVRSAGTAAGAAGTRVADPKCPSGWLLVPESVKGSRYTCRPKPPAHALKCEGGTQYFAEEGFIGCR